MVTSVAAGWFAVEHTALGLDGVFAAIAVGIVIYGATLAGSLFVKPWR